MLEGSLCYFNEGTFLIVYLPIPSIPQVILSGLMHESSGLDTQYHLNLVGWQGSQVIEHAKALVGTVNTASLNLSSRERTYRV